MMYYPLWKQTGGYMDLVLFTYIMSGLIILSYFADCVNETFFRDVQAHHIISEAIPSHRLVHNGDIYDDEVPALGLRLDQKSGEDSE